MEASRALTASSSLPPRSYKLSTATYRHSGLCATPSVDPLLDLTAKYRRATSHRSGMQLTAAASGYILTAAHDVAGSCPCLTTLHSLYQPCADSQIGNHQLLFSRSQVLQIYWKRATGFKENYNVCSVGFGGQGGLTPYTLLRTRAEPVRG